MLSPSSKMGDELKFQQRWEFRRRENDFDSSNDDSRSGSSGEPVSKRHKLVSNLISLDNDETSNTSRLQLEDNHNPSLGDPIKFGKAKKRHIRSKKDNLANSEMRRESHEEVNRKKSKYSVYDPAALDDVKNFMESLLEDLKVTRENLFTRMREEMLKLVADDTAPWPERREGNFGGEKVQSQHKKTFEDTIQEQRQQTFEKNTKLQNRSNFEENVQALHQNNSEENVQVQHQNNLERNVHVQHQNKFEQSIHMNHQKNFNSGMRAQNCNGELLERLVTSNKAVDSSNYYQAIEDQVRDGQATGPVTLTDKENGERLALSAKSNLQSSSAIQNVQVQHPKTVVLGIRAQNCIGGSLERCAKGKKTADSNNRRQAPANQVDNGRASGSMSSTEKRKGEMLGSSVEPNFSSSPSCQVASSMYLTLPSLLTEPRITNHRLDTSLCNYIQPRVPGNDTSVNSGRAANQMLDPSAHRGYFPGIQSEERIRSFAQIGSRNMSCFDQNNTPTSSIGSGFPVPLHQGMDGGFSIPSQVSLENLPQENNSIMGLRMNGGAIRFSGGSYTLPEHHVANNLHGHSNYKSDGRLAAFQIPNANNGGVFPKSFNEGRTLNRNDSSL